MLRAALLAACAGLAVPQAPAETSAGKWIPIFDGKTLNGWTPHGRASWSVEDGAIVGRQGSGGAAGDLFTVQTWSDFELEAEWRMRFPGNSGIWFRWTGPKTGYQADFIDEPAFPGVLSGSLYCMGKAFLAANRDASTVRRDDWNRIRIRAAGDEILVVQNGREVVRVRDGTFRGPGSIGIQVHAGGQFAGMEVRVRNVRLRGQKVR
ncbi:MAG: DUF1080 domain-containing protein [Acidobacteria bacterium]|nr:DUF1080 domain-containing protein [Acidobacteriota bacterium]